MSNAAKNFDILVIGLNVLHLIIFLKLFCLYYIFITELI